MSFWSVVQTETQREHLARVWMMRAGYETYAPRIRINRKRVTLLFPSYIFVRIIDRWYPIVWTPGVQRILMNGEQPARVNDGIIAAIRKREVRGIVRLPTKTIQRGQKLQITNGPFRGHVALFDGMSGPDRQRVLLGLLGQTVAVELPSRDVAILA
jgi:transcriptional antiterminator RfaH